VVLGSQSDFDVGIIGGGPGGAATAAFLAKAGISCVVFERELFPRPHVGESLVPSSTRVFKALDFLDQMEEARFPHKYGAVWTSASSPRRHSVDFEGLEPASYVDIEFAERDQPGVERPYTYHVDRGTFDLMLLQHANKLGASVYEGINVQGADFSDPDEVVIRYAMGRRECATTVRLVVDASGRRTILGNQLGWKVKDPVFDQYALHSWFEGFDRHALAGDATADYIFIHFLPLTNTWVWQIPITDTITSIGVVTQKKNFKQRRASREAFFWDCLASRPEVYETVQAAKQLRPLKSEGDYSYAMQQICGDRVLLVGDAARFVDPIFSTGVSIALNSARFASDDVINAMETGDLRRESFSTFESTMRRGTKNWHDFITVYYRLNVLFTSFIRDPRYRLDVLKLLQGDVYDEAAPPVLDKMREMVTRVEQNPGHVWHQFLGDLTNNAFAPSF
jgi:FADH2 O2-dependent halogenase